jgi:ribosomal RNA-processing protein 12
MRAAGRSTSLMRAAAPSLAGGRSLGGRSLGGRSMGAASAGGRSAGGRSAATAGGQSRGGGAQGGAAAPHSGGRFKPRKQGTGGDVKGGSKLEPYAYWSFDRKMLNRRAGKAAAASKSLGSVVRSAAAGAPRGAKARSQHPSKRARTAAD